jgi:UDP-sulfoquinovose synthase
MKILILGGDGYLGWPTAMHLSMLGHEVFIVDNYLRRKITSETDSAPIVDTPRMPERVAKFKEVSGKIIQWREIDCSIFEHLHEVIAELC